MNRSFFIFPLSVVVPLFVEICAGLQIPRRLAALIDTRPSIIESDLNAAAVPAFKNWLGVAARTGVEPVHQP